MQQGICKLCGNLSDLHKSHIVPRAFYKPLLNGKSWYREISRQEPPKKQARQWWERLLCRKCERTLKEYEDYARDAIWSGQGVTTITSCGQTIKFSGLDYTKIRLFQLRILWLASVATLKEFKDIDLGPHEDTIRTMLLTGEAGNPNTYPCVITAVYCDASSTANPEVPLIVEPERLRDESGVHIYRFFFGSCDWMYFVAKHLPKGQDWWMDGAINRAGEMKIRMVPLEKAGYLRRLLGGK